MKTKDNFKELADANAYITELNTAFTTANAKMETYEGSEIKVKQLEASLVEATEVITELGNKISLLEKSRGEKSLFVTVFDKNFKLLGNRFITKKGELDAEALSKDNEELERMVRIGSGSLIPAE